MEPSALQREVLLQLARGELNEYDEEQEDMWSTVTSMIETLRSKLTDAVKVVLSQVMKLADGYIPAITAVVSAIVTLLTSLVTLAIQYNSTAVKIALGTSILASLTAFISNIALLVKPLSKWDPSLAHPAAVELTSHIVTAISTQPETVANALDFKTWITLGITSLVAILFAGIGISGAVTWRDLITGSNVLESVKKSSNNVQNVAEFVLKDIVGLEMDRDYPQCLALEKLADEGSKLQQMSVADFLQQPEKLYQLKNYSNRLVSVTAQRFSPENSRRYNSVRQLLIEMYRQLSQKLDTINAILATKPRQVTTGLMLSGAPGVGKSEFGKYISKRVAKVLGYPTDLYCLNKKTDGFYEPYGGAALGVFNEFMAMRGEDPILRDLNLILSPDPMNFEAACLEGKSQPCQLKLAFLTSNSHNPAVVQVLSEGAVNAMWQRLYHIAVDDPLCNGRHQSNDHRKPDFSHLHFRLVEHLSPDNVRFSYMDMRTLEQRLVGRCADAERYYIKQLLNEEQSEEVRISLQTRYDALGDILRTNHPYDADRVVPNSFGREFFVTRLQGIPGSGKSTLAEQLARGCASLFNYKIQYSRDESEFIPQSEPMIYVIDDWVEENNISSYVQLMNKTHDRSMFFVTSNTEFKKVGYRRDFMGSLGRLVGHMVGLTTATPWDASEWKVPQGVLRRIGLQGFIMLPSGQLIQTPDQFNRTINCGENFVIRDAYGNVGHREQVLNNIFRSFRTFLAMPGEYSLIQGLPPAQKEPGVTLEAPDAYTLLDGLRSRSKCMAAYMGKADGFKLLVSDRLKGPGASTQTMASSWMVVEQPSNDPEVLEAVWSRLCAVFNKTFPGEALLLRLTESGSVYYYEAGMAYHYNPEVVKYSAPVEIESDCIIFYRDANTPIRVTFEEFAAARLYNQFDGPMRNCSVSEFQAINRAFTALQASKPDDIFVKRYISEEARAGSKYSPRALWLRTELKKNPIFWIGVSLISLACVGGMLFGFVKLCQAIHHHLTAKPVYATPNTNEEDVKGYKPAKKILRKIVLNSSSPRDAERPQVALRRITPRPNDYTEIDQDWEYPPHYTKAESVFEELESLRQRGQHAEHALRDLLNLNRNSPEWVKLIQAHPMMNVAYTNMLRLEDMVKSPPSDIETLHKALRKAYVHVSSDEGVCYGIHLKQGIILTVSHMFDSKDSKCEIRSDSKVYKARVIHLDRDRDLALCRVYDKTFPGLPETRRFFIPANELDRSKYGFFLRCGPDCQAMGGLISYYKSASPAITSPDNPNYRLSSKLIVHTATALEKTRTFIRLGDCGFPMVTMGSEGLRISGIHNGYNQSEKSYYSSFSREDFDELVSQMAVPNIKPYSANATELHAYELTDQNHVGLLPVAYAEAIENCKEDTRYGQYANILHILGYSSTMALQSKPKGAHQPVELDSWETEQLTLPAAYTMKYVTDDCALARTRGGVPSPLFTQCLKYDARVEPNFDPLIYEEAIGIVMQDCVSRYGGCRILRLHETLNGIPGRRLPPIDTRTSGGPLLKMLYGVSTKAPLFDVRTPEKGRSTLVFRTDFTPALVVREHYNQYMKTLIERKVPPILISKDCAKVELIDADKAASGKVRLFNEVDLSINLLFRSLFGDFASKVMEKHLESPIRMGQDPYLASTAICRQFNQIYGTVVSTDFSSFDKQLPLELIYAFCWIVSRCMGGTTLQQTDLDEIYSSLARCLTYVIHTCKGTLYLVDRGNESGTFVTTLLNSVSVDILTTYTLCRKWYSIFKFTPSLSELSAHSRKAILGDDRSLKVSYLFDITQDDLVEDSARFGLKCTSAKTHSGIDFCSRAMVWDEKHQISFPALKASSVTSQLHWTTSFSETQLLDNCDNALYEAALHADPALFNACLTDALSILRKYQIPIERLSFHSRDLIRKRFVMYVRNDGTIPTYQDMLRDFEYEDPIAYVSKIRKAHDVIAHKTYLQMAEQRQDYFDVLYFISSDKFDCKDFLSKYTKDFVINNPKSYLLSFLQNFGLSNRPEVDYTADGPYFVANFSLYGIKIQSKALNKKLAERDAYLQMVTSYFPPFSNGGVRLIDKSTIDLSPAVGTGYSLTVRTNQLVANFKPFHRRRLDPLYRTYTRYRQNLRQFYEEAYASTAEYSILNQADNST